MASSSRTQLDFFSTLFKELWRNKSDKLEKGVVRSSINESKDMLSFSFPSTASWHLRCGEAGDYGWGRPEKLDEVGKKTSEAMQGGRTARPAGRAGEAGGWGGETIWPGEAGKGSRMYAPRRLTIEIKGNGRPAGERRWGQADQNFLNFNHISGRQFRMLLLPLPAWFKWCWNNQRDKRTHWHYLWGCRICYLAGVLRSRNSGHHQGITLRPCLVHSHIWTLQFPVSVYKLL